MCLIWHNDKQTVHTTTTSIPHIIHFAFYFDWITFVLNEFFRWWNFSQSILTLYGGQTIWNNNNEKKHFEIHSKPHDVLCTWKRWSNGIKCTKLCNKNGIANKSLVAIEWSVRTHKAREYVLAMRILCENLASARKKCIICQSETLSNQFPIGWWWRDNPTYRGKNTHKAQKGNIILFIACIFRLRYCDGCVYAVFYGNVLGWEGWGGRK